MVGASEKKSIDHQSKKSCAMFVMIIQKDCNVLTIKNDCN